MSNITSGPRDVGRVAAQHLLYITGRIKELIITAGGENIAPVPIEDTVKKHAPAVSNCVLIGDRRKYNTMLVTLRTQVNPDETFSQTLVAGATEVAGQTATTVADLLFTLHRAEDTLLVVVTHDPELAARCDRRLELSEGLCVEA